MTSVKVEVTTRELVLLEPEERIILHEYDEPLNGSIFVYKVEEIIAEKIRAILQFAKQLHERGRGRSRVRDYYDLWRILHEYGQTLEKSAIPPLVQKKCANKNISFYSVEDLFQARLMECLKEWDQWLSPIVSDLPKRDMVINELQSQLNEIFKRGTDERFVTRRNE